MDTADPRALLDAFTTAWEAKDVDGLMRLMADDCAFRASVGPEPGMTFTGRDEVRRGFEQFLFAPVAGPPAETETAAPLVSERFAVARWTNRFAQPSGPPVVVHACDVFEFEGGRVRLKDTYRKVSTV